MSTLLRLSIRSSRCALIALALVGAVPAAAISTSVTSEDSADCDVLSVPALVEELGNPASPPFGPSGPFPADSAISTFAEIATEGGCAGGEMGFGPIVEIRNLTTTAFDNVWYVADLTAGFTNSDGTVNGALAVKLDAVGSNQPLLEESIAEDGIFAPGEAWYFLLQAFDDVCGFSVERMGSIGVPSSLQSCEDAGPADGSTGSIIATPVPEPGTLGLVGVGLLALVRRGRRRSRRAD